MLTTNEKQATRGRESLVSLFDAGTFVEMGAYIRRRGAEAPYDAVLTGYGSVNGKLTFAFAQDQDSLSGALDEIGAGKIQRLYEEALRVGAPVVAIMSSTGAVVTDGASALSAYGRTMKCAADASGIIPQIALVEGKCTGLSAVIASMFDFTVTVKEISEIAFNLAAARGDKDSYAEAHGLSALHAEDIPSALAAVRELISLLPRNNRDVADVDPTDDPARPVAADELTGLALVRALADNGRVVSLYENFAPELITAITGNKLFISV